MYGEAVIDAMRVQKRLGKNQIAVLEAMKERSLNRLEIASLLHCGEADFSEWHRPSKDCLSAAAKMTDLLQIKGLIEPAGKSESAWRRKYKLTERGIR